MINKPAFLALTIFVLAIVVYFFGNLDSSDLKKSNEPNSQQNEIFASEDIEINSVSQLKDSQKAEWSVINDSIKKSPENSEILKKASGFWYQNQVLDLALKYAFLVAKLENTVEAWSISGNTGLEGLDVLIDEARRKNCKKLTELSFRNAIELEPENPKYQLFLALTLVKFPGDQPMEGVKSLLDLEKKYPDYLPIQYTLTKLAIQTSQWEKAKNRILKVLGNHPEDKEANCLMLEIIKSTNSKEKVDQYIEYCEANSKPD